MEKGGKPFDHAPTKGSYFELLTSIQAVAKLEESYVIFGNVIDEMAGSPKLAQCKLVMIFVVKYIHER